MKTTCLGAVMTCVLLGLASPALAADTYDVRAGPHVGAGSLHRTADCRPGDRPIACKVTKGAAILEPTAYNSAHGRCSNKGVIAGGFVTVTCLRLPEYFVHAGPHKGAGSLHRTADCRKGDRPVACFADKGQTFLKPNAYAAGHGRCSNKGPIAGGYLTVVCATGKASTPAPPAAASKPPSSGSSGGTKIVTPPSHNVGRRGGR